jgi:ABC-type multidrug transport system fused ATPase/permease subunit
MLESRRRAIPVVLVLGVDCGDSALGHAPALLPSSEAFPTPRPAPLVTDRSVSRALPLREVARQAFGLLPKAARATARRLAALLAVRGVLEAVGVAAILPFMMIVGSGGSLVGHPHLDAAFRRVGADSPMTRVAAAGALLILTVLARNLLGIVVTRRTHRFISAVQHELSVGVLDAYFRHAERYFVEHNSADLRVGILDESDTVARKVISPLLDAVSSLLVWACILTLLLVLDWRVTCIAVICIVLAYRVLYATMRESTHARGARRVVALRSRSRATSEILGAMREIRLRDREPFFTERFAAVSRQYTDEIAAHLADVQMPRFALESTLFAALVLIVLAALATGSAWESVIPTASVFALAGYRLIPGIQLVFAGLIDLRFNAPAVEQVAQVLAVGPSARPAAESPVTVVLPFEQEIALRGVSFRYGAEGPWLLRDVDLRIRKGSTVVLIGPSGSGKTTLADLILGLVAPTEGTFAIDGVPITGPTLRAWRQKVGYVSQHPYFLDDSIRRNVAFGLEDTAIDEVAVTRALRDAHLASFVAGLPDGASTIVGENGARISGGQRQRLAIARALYADPEVLVFDEATSALDSEAESIVLEAVRELASAKTLVLITHRLDAVGDADAVFRVAGGEVVALEAGHGGANFRPQ